MADPISLGLTGAGLLSQGKANKSAKDEASRAQAAQADLLARKTQLYERIKAIVEGMRSRGAFDGTQRLQSLRNRTNDFLADARRDNSADALVSGYKPGDSEPGMRDTGILERTAKEYAYAAGDIDRQATQDELSAFSAINGSLLDSGIGAYGDMANQARSRIGSSAGLVGSIMPFLQGQKKQDNSGVVKGVGDFAINSFNLGGSSREPKGPLGQISAYRRSPGIHNSTDRKRKAFSYYA